MVAEKMLQTMQQTVFLIIANYFFLSVNKLLLTLIESTNKYLIGILPINSLQ